MRKWAVLAGVVLLAVAGTVAVVVVRHGPETGAPDVKPLSQVDSDLHWGWLPADLDMSRTKFPPGAQPGTAYFDVLDFPADRGPDLRLDGWQPFEVGGRPGRIISRPARSMADWQLPSGRWAHVEFGRDEAKLESLGPVTNRQPGVENELRRIVTEATESPVRTVTAQFGLARMPACCTLLTVRPGAVDLGAGVPQDRPADGLVDGILDDTNLRSVNFLTRLSIKFEPGMKTLNMSMWKRLPDIQGGEAYFLWTTEMPMELDIRGFHGGTLRLVGGGSQDELVQVARSVVWTGP
jgi:hypothetical protein